MDLQTQIYPFIEKQLSQWSFAKKNYDNLSLIKTRTFLLPTTKIVLQFNPTRIASTGAKLDAESISKRKCFLCLQNQPAEELSMFWQDYVIQLNPYPIFPNHLVIAHRQHILQDINGHFSELLSVSEQLPNFAVFFNGINCGASAPDHLHFQAAEQNSFPLLVSYDTLEKTPFFKKNGAMTYKILGVFRTVFCIESSEIQSAISHFEYLKRQLFDTKTPMMNLLCSYSAGRWLIFVFPRKKSRPWQYEAPEPQTLMVSPGTAEMSGVVVLPKEEHFQRINLEDIIDIYQQVGL